MQQKIFLLWNGKRNSLEIFESILGGLEEGQLKKTHITYKANLDSRLASKYIQALLKFDMIAKSSKEPSYFIITPKGRYFLEQYHGLVKIVDSQ